MKIKGKKQENKDKQNKKVALDKVSGGQATHNKNNWPTDFGFIDGD